MSKLFDVVGRWVIFLVFFVTIPVRAQALVLCFGAEGGAVVELSSPGGCKGCDGESPSGGLRQGEERCGCTDITLNDASASNGKKLALDPARLIAVTPFIDLIVVALRSGSFDATVPPLPEDERTPKRLLDALDDAPNAPPYRLS